MYLPKDVEVLIVRLICSILMHLNVKGEIQRSLRMMKFVVNHENDFRNPSTAFFIGIMQFIGGLGTEVLCIVYLSHLHDTIEIIVRFIALGAIFGINGFYARSLPD